MADQEHFALLKQGVRAWNTWRKQHPSISPDLSVYSSAIDQPRYCLCVIKGGLARAYNIGAVAEDLADQEVP